MRDLKRYWQEVRALQASLPAFLWLVDDLGSLVEVTAEVAAKLLQGKTHRVATKEEIRAHAGKRKRMDTGTARKDKESAGVGVVSIEESGATARASRNSPKSA